MEHPILTLRNYLDLTQADLAGGLDCTPGRISQIENGSAPIGGRLLSKLYKRYGRDLKRLKISPLAVLDGPRGET
jgi:transcriptional regulator with XRE-family HTH domain